MAEIINFPPQPGMYEKIADDFLFDGAKCLVGSIPGPQPRECSGFVSKYPNDPQPLLPDCVLCANCQLKEE